MVSVAKSASATSEVRAKVAALRARYDGLCRSAVSNTEWRRLQYDAVHAFVDAQRVFVETQSAVLRVLRTNKPLYTRLRNESADLASTCAELRELIHKIERASLED